MHHIHRWAACLFFCAILSAQTAPNQAQLKAQFEDLARRAMAALDARPEEAAGLLKQALAIQPKWAEGWLSMGGALYRLGRYAEATDALRKGVAGAPAIGTGWGLLGLAESQLEDQDQALADIRKGEELGFGNHPDFDIAVRVRAAQMLVLSSTFDEALAQLQPLTQQPTAPPALIAVTGACLLSMPEDVAKLSDQRRAVVDLAGKAGWAMMTQHPDVAESTYRQLVSQYPNEPGVHYALGRYLAETDIKGALAEFEKETQNNPKHWPSYVFSSSLDLQRGMPEQAIEASREALKSIPAKYRWMCHADIGRANVALKNTDAAISELENASRQVPANARVHFYLAQAYRQAGRKADADRESGEFERLKNSQDPLGVSVTHAPGSQ